MRPTSLARFLSPFRRPPALLLGAERPNLYRVVLTSMITEWWLVFGAWIAAGLVVACLGFPILALSTTIVGVAADVVFQRRLRERLMTAAMITPEEGLRRLTPIVAARFTLAVIGPVTAALLAPTPQSLAVVLLIQAWSICVAMAQFSPAPRLYYIAIAPCLMAIALALGPHFARLEGAAAAGALALLTLILLVIGRQMGVVWRRWDEACADNLGMIEALSAARADAERQRDIARQAEAAAQAASRAKSTFLSTMSHEIRTPLNGVLGMAQLMDVDELSGRQRERVHVLRQSGEALLATLNSVLDLSRIEAGRLELRQAPCAPSELADQVAAAFSASAEIKGLYLGVDATPEAHDRRMIDGPRVRQILFNIVGNAVKFTETGGVTLMVRASADRLWFEVRDTGPGVHEQDRERLFRPFEQLDAAYTREKGGSGLGLAISAELVGLMKGDIRVESGPDGGAIFIVELPAQPAPVDRVPGADTVAAAPARGLRALIAEDNPTNQMVITAVMNHLGFVVEAVADGQAALESWRRGGFDIVLMDVQMPIVDGLDATRRIRATEDPQSARIPVLGLTGNAMEHQVQECLDAGMDSVVTKPIQIEALAHALSQLLGAPDDAIAAAVTDRSSNRRSKR